MPRSRRCNPAVEAFTRHTDPNLAVQRAVRIVTTPTRAPRAQHVPSHVSSHLPSGPSCTSCIVRSSRSLRSVRGLACPASIIDLGITQPEIVLVLPFDERFEELLTVPEAECRPTGLHTQSVATSAGAKVAPSRGLPAGGLLRKAYISSNDGGAMLLQLLLAVFARTREETFPRRLLAAAKLIWLAVPYHWRRIGARLSS